MRQSDIEQIKKMVEESYDTEVCEGCRHNPKATKPFKKMRHLPETILTKKLLDKLEEKDLNRSCFSCFVIRKFLLAYGKGKNA